MHFVVVIALLGTGLKLSLEFFSNRRLLRMIPNHVTYFLYFLWKRTLRAEVLHISDAYVTNDI